MTPSPAKRGRSGVGPIHLRDLMRNSRTIVPTRRRHSVPSLPPRPFPDPLESYAPTPHAPTTGAEGKAVRGVNVGMDDKRQFTITVE